MLGSISSDCQIYFVDLFSSISLSFNIYIACALHQSTDHITIHVSFTGASISRTFYIYTPIAHLSITPSFMSVYYVVLITR